LTDANGNIVQRYDYTPYGQTTASAAGFNNPYQYTGRELDQSGLYYYRARYYSPQMGRFISEDPIGLAGGLNVYVYVGGNLINYVDLLGLIDEAPRGTSPGLRQPGYPVVKTPTSEISLAERIMSSKIVEKLTFGLFKVGKTGGIIASPAGAFLFFYKPAEMGCAEIDCDKDGIADVYQRLRPNQCLRPDIYGVEALMSQGGD
jgi:RHS repeat-associated protein